MIAMVLKEGQQIPLMGLILLYFAPQEDNLISAILNGRKGGKSPTDEESCRSCGSWCGGGAALEKMA